MRTVRAGGAALALLGIGLLLAPGVDAAGPVARQAWTRMAPVPTFVAETARVYVAADVGTESARSFVRVAVDQVPAEVDGGVSLLLVAASGTSTAEAAAVVACPLTSPIVADGELSSDAAPTADCSNAVAAVRGAAGRWVVPLDGLVQRWRDDDDLGLALVPVLTGTASFRLAFDVGATAIDAPVSARAGEGPPASPDGAIAADVAAAADVLTGGAAGPVAPAPPEPLVETHVSPDSRAVAVASGGARIGPIEMGGPRTALVLVAAGMLALVGSLPISGRRRVTAALPATPSVTVSRSTVTGAVGAAALLGAPLLLAEADVYKVGLVLILFVAAIGLHLLVNWAGELSLAHATLVGLPAFVVAKLSADSGASPIVLLPVAVVVGLFAGAVVGLPAVRARGLQVALVTLAAGVAIDRFFFTREWLVGDVAGVKVATPTLGPITFTTTRSLYPLLAVAVVASIAAAWGIHRSKVGRALTWVKAQPEAAAAFGVSVGRYRTIAYALAGAFAGLSGGLTAIWVQQLTPQAFPLSRSFTYLIVVALAGRGFVGGVAAAAAAVEGGRLFLASSDAFITYAAPLGLIFTLTRHPAGLNGLGRELATRLRRERKPTFLDKESPVDNKLIIRPWFAGGVVAIVLGFTAIALAWYHAGNTSHVWIQNQEMISGGLGGLAAVIVGVGLIVYDRVLALKIDEATRWERLLSAVERPGDKR